jgi:hypothetical protein
MATDANLKITAILLLLIVIQPPLSSVAAEPSTQPSGAHIFETKEFAIALPEGWTAMERLQNERRPLHAPGDGKGIPALDETGAPLQAGIGVEHFQGFKYTLSECVKVQKESIARARNLELIGEPIERSITLADKRPAVLIAFQFVKDGRRHSTQVKLIVKGDGDDHWIASAWAVGSKDSKQLSPDQPLVEWLSAHIETFTLDPSKINRDKLPPPLFPQKDKQ